MLKVDRISKSFGGLKAVQDFSLDLQRGDLQGLIGPNGAGKTTLFNLLTGVYKPAPGGGAITLDGRPLNGLRPHRIAAAGLSRTFQNIRLFGELSALDNVRLACHVRSRSRMPGAILRSVWNRAEERAMTFRARELLNVFDLARFEDEQARN